MSSTATTQSSQESKFSYTLKDTTTKPPTIYKIMQLVKAQQSQDNPSDTLLPDGTSLRPYSTTSTKKAQYVLHSSHGKDKVTRPTLSEDHGAIPLDFTFNSSGPPSQGAWEEILLPDIRSGKEGSEIDQIRIRQNGCRPFDKQLCDKTIPECSQTFDATADIIVRINEGNNNENAEDHIKVVQGKMYQWSGKATFTKKKDRRGPYLTFHSSDDESGINMKGTMACQDRQHRTGYSMRQPGYQRDDEELTRNGLYYIKPISSEPPSESLQQLLATRNLEPDDWACVFWVKKSPESSESSTLETSKIDDNNEEYVGFSKKGGV